MPNKETILENNDLEVLKSFFEEFKDTSIDQHDIQLLELFLNSNNTVQLTKLFSQIVNTDQQYLIKLLALVIIKKLEGEALEEFKEEQDPINKLNILSEAIDKIKKIQEDLVSQLPEIESPLFKELKLPACDFAHFQNKDNKKIGHTLDKLASKAFKIASETNKSVIKSEEISGKIFEPIFKISKQLRIGNEEVCIYIDKIKEKIKNIENTEKIVREVKSQDIQLISTELAMELFKCPKKCSNNKMIVYNEDHTVSYLMIRVQGVVKKFYLRNEEQYKIFNILINKALKIPNTPISRKSKISKNGPCLLSTQDNQEITDCFDSLVGTNLKYQESKCKVAHNELSGFRHFYRQQQEACIRQIKSYLKQHNSEKNIDYLTLSNIDIDETEEDFNKRTCLHINKEIIPKIQLLLKSSRKKLLDSSRKKSSETSALQLFLDNMQQLLTNRFGYRSVSRLARNYELIKEFQKTTLKDWQNGITGYEENINDLLNSIRPGQKEFGYHKGIIIYLANYKLEPQDCKKTPTIVYDSQTKKVLYLIIHNGQKNVKLSLPKSKIFKQNLAKTPRSFNRVFISHKNKLIRTIMSLPSLKHRDDLEKSFTYAPTKTEKLSQIDLRGTIKGGIRKLVFNKKKLFTQQIDCEDKFLIIKDHDGEINIVHHHGGNRLYKPQDILPINKNMPTALFLLGIGHFGDVKAGFLPSGEQQVIKVVRMGSTNSETKRQSHKDIWDEREDDLHRELKGLKQNKKLISYGATRSYLRKITKEKKELLHVIEEQLAPTDISSKDCIKDRNSNGRSSTARPSINSQQEEQQQNLTFMAGNATHILMELSGAKDLREEINERMAAKVLPDNQQSFKEYFIYFVNRAIKCCDILEEQHKEGTHNDFKPANIAVTRDGNLEIIDFGTYKQNSENEQSKPLNPVVHGTPVFMNPRSLITIHNELATHPMQTSSLFDDPTFPDKPYTPNNLKEYYIRRRLKDILGDQNINISTIKDIKHLITIILKADNKPTPVKPKPPTASRLQETSKLYKKKKSTSYCQSAPNITEASFKLIHQSQEEYNFNIANQGISTKQKINWTVKDEIALLFKTIEKELKNKPVANQFSMKCDTSYDIYSLVSMISGSANKYAYLTNVILRYGNLNDKDLLNLVVGNEEDLVCPIQNYSAEGQGLQLDQLFYALKTSQELHLTPEKRQEFISLQEEWIKLRDQVLLQQLSYKQLKPKDFKKILNDIKEKVLDLKVTQEKKVSASSIKLKELLNDAKKLENTEKIEQFLHSKLYEKYEALFDKIDGTKVSLLEIILKSQNKSILVVLKKLLKNQSQREQDQIKFITDLCCFNYPNNFAKIILDVLQDNQDKLQESLVNFYRLLTNIVFPIDDPENYEKITKNRKLAAGILLASMPSSYVLNLIPKELEKNLTTNDIETIKLIRNTTNKNASNLIDTILNPNNINIFQEDLINIEPRLWHKRIEANIFFSKKEYEENIYALLKNDKVELFKKLFESLSSNQTKELQKELLWVRGVADHFNSFKIISYLEAKGISKTETLLDLQSILDFIIKQCIKQIIDNLSDDVQVNCVSKITNNTQIKDQLKKQSASLNTISRVKNPTHSKTDITLCSKIILQKRQSQMTSSEFYELIDQYDPLKSVISQFFSQSHQFDLSVYNKETLAIFIEAVKQAKLPCKKSLIDQFVENLTSAKKLKENADQKTGAKFLVAYQMASSRSEQYEESWNILKKAQRNFDRLYNCFQQEGKDYKAAWNVLKKAQRNFDHLFLQQKVNHGLGKKSNEYPKI